ncbi:MAG: STAS/SEC14 domain-containing protein [Blastopirellula sp. JB062]
MAAHVKEVVEEKYVEIQLTGKLTVDDYHEFVPIMEKQIEASGKLRLLVVLHDFHGWQLSAIWEDTKFGVKHYRDIERLAVVGESKWEQGMASFCKPFTAAEIQYFDQAKIEEARQWIQA